MTINTVEALIYAYKNGQRIFHNLELEDQPDSFVGVDLRNADLSGSIIVGDFSRANLKSVIFNNCNLKTSSFNKADLRNAVFINTALCSTTFKGSQLEGSDFTGASFHGHVMKPGEFPNW